LDVNLSPYLILLTFSFFFGREKNVNSKNFFLKPTFSANKIKHLKKKFLIFLKRFHKTTSVMVSLYGFVTYGWRTLFIRKHNFRGMKKFVFSTNLTQLSFREKKTLAVPWRKGFGPALFVLLSHSYYIFLHVKSNALFSVYMRIGPHPHPVCGLENNKVSNC
jgi:hypothetical protein